MKTERLIGEGGAKEMMRMILEVDVFDSPEKLPDDEQELIEAAKQAMETAHSPYSDFKVGAAVRIENGEIITGSNQENASYGLTMCAERVALFAAGAAGKKYGVLKIAIIGTGRNFETTQPVTPCGACRQVMKEYEDLAQRPMTILMSGASGSIYRTSEVASLLPFAFGPKDLNITK